MNWSTLRQTNPEAARLAESGKIREAVYAYAHGGCYSYSRTDRRQREKAQLSAGQRGRNRNAARAGVDARIFYTSFRRFAASLPSSPL